MLERIAAAAPDALVVCAYGVLIREPLLSAYEIFNVHPSLLPRWRGAAPVERAIMAGDAETGVSIMRLTAGLDSGPGVPARRRADRPRGRLRHARRAAAGAAAASCSCARSTSGRRGSSRTRHGVTYAHKIEAADRALDPTRTPEELERHGARAAPAHRRAAAAARTASFLGVLAAPARPGRRSRPAGGRVRTDGDRLLLDCRGGALELTEIQPPGGRPMAAADWLRGRPDPALTDFWLDPRLPGRPVEELVRLAVGEWDSGEEWAPHLAALGWRGTPEVLAALAPLAADPDPRARSVAAYVAGQLGAPVRTMPGRVGRAAGGDGRARGPRRRAGGDRRGVRPLGEPWGLAWLLRLRRHPDAGVRDGVVSALAGRENPLATDALIELSADPRCGDPRLGDVRARHAGPQDSPALRDALAARLEDADPEARIEAVHGLALRGDLRARRAGARAAARPGAAGGSLWTRHALQEAAIRLAAQSGDRRFAPHLPALDDGWRGTTLERELERALARCAG